MSAEPAFTGARLDRAGDARRRDPAWVAEQLRHPAARAVLAGDAGVVMEGDRLARLPLGEAPAGEPLLLGIDADGPLFVVDVDAPADVGADPPPLIAAGGRPRERTQAQGSRQVALREAVAVLRRDEGGLVAYVAALCNWHRRHRFCSTCGAPSEVAEAGLIRKCPRCGTDHHPRTDPVVIMLVTDGDRVMLGRAPSWPPRRYSALAGFVEPGEALEDAVAREVFEESGVVVGAPRYLTSQPWPFPSSLMLGFDAPYRSGEPHPGEADIDDVRWFTRAEVAAAAERDAEGWGDGGETAATLILPPRLAIARTLLEGWLAG